VKSSKKNRNKKEKYRIILKIKTKKWEQLKLRLIIQKQRLIGSRKSMIYLHKK